MDKIGSTEPSASKEDIAKVKQDVEQLAAKLNTISDKQNALEEKQNAMEAKQNSVESSQSDLAAKLDASTANLQTSLEAQTAELKKYVDNIPPPANVPVGTVVDWAGDGRGHPVPPKGWLFCDGSYLKITEHPKLYAVLKNIYNSDPFYDDFDSRIPDGDFRLPPGEILNNLDFGNETAYEDDLDEVLPSYVYNSNYTPTNSALVLKSRDVHMLKIIKDD